MPIIGFFACSILFAGSLAVAACLYLRTPPPVSPSGPMLVAEPAVVDLGQVGPAYHDTVIHLVNRSKYPIAILDVKTTCSCTRVSFLRKMIEAGENAELHCLFDTNDKEGKTGAKLAIVYVPQTDDLDVDTSPHHLAVDLLADVKPLGDNLPAIVSLD